jgi:hypothetical protein
MSLPLPKIETQGASRGPFPKCYHGGLARVPLCRSSLHLAGTSGTNSPYGMRSWKYRITAVSLRGIEIASASP